MNRVAKWMMRLYPAAWRARYGDEMDALLADSGADAKTIANLLAGGIRMRFSKGSFLKLAVGLGVAGMLLGLGASYLRKPQYVSHATLEMTAVHQNSTPTLNEIIQALQTQVMSRTTLSRIIKDPRLDLYSDERKDTPLEDVIDEMRGSVRIQYMALPGNLGRRATAFNISFSYTDKVKAQRTVNSLINAFEELNQETQLGAGNRSFGNVLEVLDAASLPAQPTFPNRPRFAWFGGLLGFLLACAITVIRSLRRSSSTAMLATNE
jgi:LPS O-antigen subunit length determinant protein (WzzB/FepE family)